MHINPFEDQWDEKRKKEYLVEHDWGVIMVSFIKSTTHVSYAEKTALAFLVKVGDCIMSNCLRRLAFFQMIKSF